MPVAAVTYDFLSPGRTAAKGATVRVHAALREAIVQLDLKPGEYLDKQAIAAVEPFAKAGYDTGAAAILLCSADSYGGEKKAGKGDKMRISTGMLLPCPARIVTTA